MFLLIRFLDNRGGGIYKYTDNTQFEAGVTLFDVYRLKKADIVFLGDSITARCDWSEVFPEYVTANRGIGSDTTQGVKNRLNSVVSLRPEMVVILIGVNDVSYKIEAQSTDNMSTILKELKEAIPDLKIIVVSVLPATSDMSTLYKIRDMNESFKTVCKEKACTFLDVYGAFAKENGTPRMELYSDDIIHLNGEGYSVLFDALEDKIKELS